MRAYLKIKIKSLADEARSIRAEELKHPGGDVRTGLYLHRINVVRPEARAAQLAYAYLRNKRYRQIEATCQIAPNRKRILDLACKYGPNSDKEIVRQDINRWLDEPEADLKAA